MENWKALAKKLKDKWTSHVSGKRSVTLFIFYFNLDIQLNRFDWKEIQIKQKKNKEKSNKHTNKRNRCSLQKQT